MTWFEAWAVVNLGTLKATLGFMGAAGLGLGIWKVVAPLVDADNKSYQDRSKKEEYWNAAHKKAKRAVYTTVAICGSLWLAAGWTPTISDLGKMIAIKYGYDAVTSERAEQNFEKALKSVENLISAVEKKTAKLAK